MADWQKKARIFIQKSTEKANVFLKWEYSPRGLGILFLLALCVGFLTKSILNDSITIGHDDYTLSRDKRIIDLNLLEKSFIRQKDTSDNQPIIPKGETCAEREE